MPANVNRLIFASSLIIVISIAGYFFFQQNSLEKLSCQQKPTCFNCNLILISADSLRSDHVGAFGYKRNTTPNFDKLAKNGVLYKNFYTTSYLTPISEMSLQTGMYPSTNGYTRFEAPLSDKYLTIAQILKKDSYNTYAVHSSPEFGYYDRELQSFDRGFDSYTHFDKSLNQYDVRKVPDMSSITKLWEISKNNKFFNWISVGSIHWPYGLFAKDLYTSKEYNGYFKNKTLEWGTFKNIYNNTVYPEKKKLTPSDVQYIVDMYDNGITQFDDFLGDLYSQLERRNLLQKTIIVIESEHGEDFGEHGYFSHYDIRDNQVHTPLLIIYPDSISKQINSLVSSVDVLPTILDLLGIGIPKQVQGNSTVPLYCGQEKDNRNMVFIERNPLWEESAIASDMNLRGIKTQIGNKDIAVRTDNWKFILRYSKKALEEESWWGYITGTKIVIPEKELYDLKKDPLELNNIVSSEPQVANNLEKILIDWKEKIENINPDRKQYPLIQKYF